MIYIVICMQDFFRCQDGFESKADVATRCCKKLVVDMHYEARIQAIISFHTDVLREGHQNGRKNHVVD